LKKYEFEAILNTLHYGYSNIMDKTKLYFDYSTSFLDFLETLRQQTVLCTIPPLDFHPVTAQSELLRSPTRETSKTLSHEKPSRDTSKELSMQEGQSQEIFNTYSMHEEPSQATSKTLSMREESSCVDCPIRWEGSPTSISMASNSSRSTPPRDSPPSSSKGLVPKNGTIEQEASTFITPTQPNKNTSTPTADEREDTTDSKSSRTPIDHSPHDPSQVEILGSRGYTLADGPWQFKIQSKEASGHYSNIANEEDYIKMLDALKKEGTTGSTRTMVVIVHVCIQYFPFLLHKETNLLTSVDHGLCRMEERE
jgi:hypothetical protein